MSYNFKKIEKKWQKIWAKNKYAVWHAEDGDPSSHKATKGKTYVLDMFPYPSGEGLHVGHVEGYTASDIYSRFLRMNGHNVLHPMGWDAFGLPAENYAIKTKTHPSIVVKKNVKRFKEQLNSLGFSYDWQREINTTDSEYYKWTQWIFLQLFKKGLAYEAELPVNWCPNDKTVLANEEVIDGCCERCGAEVERKKLKQWILKITAYADRLLADLEKLDWPERVKEMQRNWIGRSEGALIGFQVVSSKFQVEVFTTRPDTLAGATYMVLSPEHPLIWNLESRIENLAEVKKYIEKAKNKSDRERQENKEKTGVALKGIMAVNPINQEKIPVWVSDYVLVNYGTGAIMAVPAHDARDFEFAKKFKLPIKEVVIPLRVDKKNPPIKGKETVERKTVHALVRDPKSGKILCVKWRKFPWTGFVIGGVDQGEDVVAAARREVLEETGYKNLKFVRVLGGLVRGEYFAAHKDENRIAYSNAVLFDLENDERVKIKNEEVEKHDAIWLDPATITPDNFTCAELDLWFERMRVAHDAYEDEGVLINSGQFDGLLSKEAKNKITDFVDGKITVKYKLRDWIFSRQRYWGEPIPVIKCEKCGTVAVAEADLPVELPKVKNYEPTGNAESPLAAITKWVSVKCPKCGGNAKRETNTMPQWAGSCWYYIAYVARENSKFQIPNSKKTDYWLPVDLYLGGVEHAVLHLLYARFWHKFLFDIGVVSTKEPFMKLVNQGLILGPDNQKMSKSKGNVVSPDQMVEKFGADSLRLYEMFMGPLEDAKPWDPTGIVGVHRFLGRIYAFAEVSKKNKKPIESESLRRLVHKTIKKVTEDIQSFHFNTAISAMMILLNELEKQPEAAATQLSIVAKLLFPLAPHLAQEVWKMAGNKNLLDHEVWPKWDEKLMIEDQFELLIQVNGKLRGKITAERGIGEEGARALAISNPDVKKWLGVEKPKKVIFVPNRLINFII